MNYPYTWFVEVSSEGAKAGISDVEFEDMCDMFDEDGLQTLADSKCGHSPVVAHRGQWWWAGAALRLGVCPRAALQHLAGRGQTLRPVTNQCGQTGQVSQCLNVSYLKNSDCNIVTCLDPTIVSTIVFRRKMGLTRTIPSRCLSCLRDAGTLKRASVRKIFRGSPSRSSIWTRELCDLPSCCDIPGLQKKGDDLGKSVPLFPFGMAILRYTQHFWTIPYKTQMIQMPWSSMINCWSYIPIKYPMRCHTDWYGNIPHFPMFEIDEVAITWAGNCKFSSMAGTSSESGQSPMQEAWEGTWGDAVPLQWWRGKSLTDHWTMELEVGQVGHLWIPWKKPHDLPHDLLSMFYSPWFFCDFPSCALVQFLTAVQWSHLRWLLFQHRVPGGWHRCSLRRFEGIGFGSAAILYSASGMTNKNQK